MAATATAAAGSLGLVSAFDQPVPMRDGVELSANVFRPDADGRFPAILWRTPYGKPAAGFERYVRAGYVVVTQDTRGRYGSGGEYRPFTVAETGDGEDGYDSIEWLAAQPFCNGRVGTLGASYAAWMQWQAAALRPPHLVAMIAYTIPLELTAVDWPGGFRPGRRIKWWLTTIGPDLRRRAGLPPPHTPEHARRLWDELAEESRWLGYLPWTEFAAELPPGLADYARDWLEHPDREPWRFADKHAEVAVPNLDVSGWYDHCNGSMRHLQGMQRNAASEAAQRQTKLVAGPWNHPGLGQRVCGAIDYGPQAEVDLPDLFMRWFDYWLKQLPNGVDREPPVRYFVMGAGHWRTAATWPPPDTRAVDYFLVAQPGTADAPPRDDAARLRGGALEPAIAAEPATVSYRYDPRTPVPTLWTREWFTSAADRRQLETRSDILWFRSAPLATPVEIAGYPEAVLYVESTAPDTDFFARLVDEAPVAGDGDASAGGSDGRDAAAAPAALEMCYGMTRVRHRNGLQRSEPVAPGQVVELRIQLGPTACRFAAGHRIRVEITSSDYPNHDRNHNTGGADLAETELKVAIQTLHTGGERPARLILPVLE